MPGRGIFWLALRSGFVEREDWRPRVMTFNPGSAV